MRRAGGVVGLVAGVLGTIAALATPLLGGLEPAGGADAAVGLDWFGLSLSTACIALGALAMGARSRWPGILLTVTALLAAVFGGGSSVPCTVLALIGGVLASIPAPRRAIVTRVLPGAHFGPTKQSH